ncbi:sigma-70 family RNA polymerase sigma factor [Nocardioides taihuensis]|uniref:Sigma-70 family RNA polymerase sigma factor n=1 Tax=Nocardioides taihuensis TaxID=1835606 RepID=A0ABW0BET1_9ACTN
MRRCTLVEGMLRVEDAADAELISAVRDGDLDAYGELFGRHVDAARRLARQLVPPADADDLVSEAFTKVLVVLQRGGGPDLAFRAYLLTAVRRLHVDRIRATSRLHTTDDMEAFDPGVPFRDTAVEGFDNAAAARAFASLPERWQMVLWHTEVEGQKPGDIAPLLGLSANSVAALAYRAREGLRQAFLSMHVQELDEDTCTWTHQNLGAYVRGGASRRDAARVEAHLAECRRCTAIHLELTEVNSSLSAIIAPLLLGAAATAYVGSSLGALAGAAGAAAAGKMTVPVLLDRVKDLAVANVPATAAGVAAAVAVAAVGTGTWLTSREDEVPTAREPAATAQAVPGGADREPVARGARRDPAPRDTAGDGPGYPASYAVPPTDATAPPSPTSAAGAAEPTSPETGPGDPPGGPSTPPPAPPPDPSTPPGTPAPGPDLAVSAEASATPGGLYHVEVAVSGFERGVTGTLAVAGDGVQATLTLDGRCFDASPDAATCTADGPTTFSFTALAPLPPGASLTFTLTPDGGPADADPSDNRVVVPLG